MMRARCWAQCHLFQRGVHDFGPWVAPTQYTIWRPVIPKLSNIGGPNRGYKANCKLSGRLAGWMSFCIFEFGANFLPIQKLKKHILSKPPKISKNSTMDAQWLDSDDFLEPFGHPFFIKIRNHANLVNCNSSTAKLVLLLHQAFNFSIKIN